MQLCCGPQRSTLTTAHTRVVTEAALQAIDQNVNLDGAPVMTATTCCIDSTVSGSTWKISPGPTPQPAVSGAC